MNKKLNGDSRRSLKKSSQTELTVFKLIHARTNISRVELAAVSGMSTAAMSGTVHSLLQKRLIVEVPQPSSGLGRRRIALNVRPDLAYVLGVDLGSYNLRVVISDINGKIVHGQRLRTEMSLGRQGVLDRTFTAMRSAIRESGLDPKNIRGIGVGHSGVIDIEKGMVLSFPRPGQMEEWKNIPLQKMMEDEFGIPCLLEDSARAIAIAEKHFGAGENLKDFLYIDVGMGIGAAIFIGGVLYRGSNGSAGEVGHITVEENGPLCFCGNRGCLEALASCAAIIGNVKSAIHMGVATGIAEKVNGDLERINVETIAEAAAQNDSLGYRTLDNAATRIGVAAADLVNLLNPSALILGGGLFRAAPEFLLDHLKRTIRQRALEKSANDVHLIGSKLGTEGGAMGAARLIAEQLLPGLYEADSAHPRKSAGVDPSEASLSGTLS
jgi:glucokinase-like ROK family protein